MLMENIKLKIVTKDGEVLKKNMQECFSMDKDSIESVHYLLAKEMGREVYSNDIIRLNIKDAEDGFTNSKVGELMETRGYDEIEVECFEDDTRNALTVNFIVRFLVDGRYVTEKEFETFGFSEEEIEEYERTLDEFERENQNKPYEEVETQSSNVFIRYLLLKGAKVQ